MIGQLLVVAVGGAFGAMARYGASLLGGLVFGRDTWVTTFAINVVGAFLLGALAGLVTRRVEHWQLLNGLVAIGFLGAFTTFSTYALETVRLWQEGRVATGVAYAAGSVVAALAAAWIGSRLTLG